MEFSNPHVEETLQHKAKVAGNLIKISNRLMERATVHDNSKFSDAEMAEYTRAEHERLAGVEVQPLGDALEHHYTNNRHHPQYHETGIQGMSVIDLIEMVCDWKAAGERGKERGGEPQTKEDLIAFVDGSVERFDIDNTRYYLILGIIEELYI